MNGGFSFKYRHPRSPALHRSRHPVMRAVYAPCEGRIRFRNSQHGSAASPPTMPAT
jgi:hypothetical protein